jgi:hypothetical protein
MAYGQALVIDVHFDIFVVAGANKIANRKASKILELR